MLNTCKTLTLVFAILLCFRAGKPPPGLHLDVMKGDKLIEVTHRPKMLYVSHKNKSVKAPDTAW